ncbi:MULTISPECIES: ribosome-binding factor A [Lactobacillus]|uniref:Ribosome-binding factor A n=1 Tax=Lactobacillus melliventris TaxID=1218507 RepID=A0A0F4LEH5_9LACO|nr:MULTISPECIES: ribosome-binding factor A [Lactobacillus]MEB3365412.1 ribosome-binding factor A [Lactobacillus sp. R2/2]KJY56728.1 Ribosome-binding factor A [Lactobacillus melliventris]MBC6350393.1 ribosome-binding factor A [Lactobacillus melliventris]MBH9989652.1 ribosome-binding factor A [Lactobacillus sp. M0392]MBI0023355.1 ribosome-binding factor A [Lactobacillus sp. W8171]
MKHRIGRVEGEILRELTKILRKNIRDPRVNDVTITAVECTNDLSYATVYYSILSEDAKKEEEAAAGLNKAKGMMRHLLGQVLTVYKVPELIFKRDNSVKYGSKIDRLIAEVKKQDENRNN